MAEKRMMILPADVIKKIDDNRGDLSQADFINFLLDNQLKREDKEKQAVGKEEIISLIESQIKEALHLGTPSLHLENLSIVKVTYLSQEISDQIENYLLAKYLECH